MDVSVLKTNYSLNTMDQTFSGYDSANRNMEVGKSFSRADLKEMMSEDQQNESDEDEVEEGELGT